MFESLQGLELQEQVLRPLLQRFFARHETEAGGWQWSRSREQARPLVPEHPFAAFDPRTLCAGKLCALSCARSSSTWRLWCVCVCC